MLTWTNNWKPRYYVQHEVGSRSATARILSVAEIHDVICHLPDTAPGMGGVPYAAWRADPLFIACIYRIYLVPMCRDPEGTFRSTPSRVQLMVYIGKNLPSLSPVDRRPLGLSATFIRILSALAYVMLQRCLQQLLHTSQVLVGSTGDSLSAALEMQEFSDSAVDGSNGVAGGYDALPRSLLEQLEDSTMAGLDHVGADLRVANLADFQQAFERISPSYVRDVLCCWRLPLWLLQFAVIFLACRFARILHGHVMGVQRSVLSGVDMGTQAAPFLFMVGRDPMLCMAAVLPGMSVLRAYMDDVAAGTSIRGAFLFQRLLHYFRDVGPLLTVQHSCWRLHRQGDVVNSCGFLPAWSDLGHYTRCCHCSGHEVWLCGGDARTLPGCPPPSCECTCKLVCVLSRRPTPAEWRCLHVSPWGPQVYHCYGEYLGIWVAGADLWEVEGAPDVQLWRSDRNYAKGLGKLEGRVQLLRGCRLSGPLSAGGYIVFPSFPMSARTSCPAPALSANTMDICVRTSVSLASYRMLCWLMSEL